MRWWNGLCSLWRRIFNARLHRRLPIGAIPVRLWRKEDPNPRTETITNWSPGGLYVPTSDVWPLETLCKVEFDLSGDGGASIRLDGQVVRHHFHQSSHRPDGMGIMFSDFTQSGLAILQELVRQLPQPSRKASGPHKKAS